ncbi:MAG: hypothetical protein Q8L45_01860 [Xanthomonadaceae bacterium]|nr:hypothetical protein [Xanthomonadaceae bacterium]MDP2185426.1 hypothetical protein [Xanthomonadales bacterium]MDZ4116226.1 hypothetical protein [Xanthomonadaceae bacterium]MDZ4376994.1 hypothetical protein [Xanthomonadaceae bacterium]
MSSLSLAAFVFIATIAAAGDPLRDVSTLEHVGVVVKGGVVIRDTLSAH